ncbi:MAG TPA: membrane-bound O-acyltransferase family protein [Bacteroidetes bacterium]|nr:membrane-bound O-acyltransferase family protein [Bacteroidota bacterium]
MLFNSLKFLVFFIAVFGGYWSIRPIMQKLGKLSYVVSFQNLLLLLASYTFYAAWNVKFLGLILASSVLDYYVGKRMSKTRSDWKRKALLGLSLSFNLGMLGLFKYFDFFSESFADLLHSVGMSINPVVLGLALPVGISFYTFQTLSYAIDVYRNKIPAEKKLLTFLVYVAYFPQLVAGPIERASRFLPQLHSARSFSYTLAIDGCRQILWGFFKKVVVADTCALFANEVFAPGYEGGGVQVALGILFFTLQIYGDFSGYSDIAIGISKLMGIQLMQNFATPYFSRNIGEFWRRWHISLSTWFRDYLYIPLGGSRTKPLKNILIIFLVSGFWHGANWTFILWGAYHALLYVPLFLMGKNRSHLDSLGSSGTTVFWTKELPAVLTTFILVAVGWVFFRAESIHHAYRVFLGLKSTNYVDFPLWSSFDWAWVGLYISIMIVIEFLGRNHEHPLQGLNISVFFRWSLYLFLSFLVIHHFGDEAQFIYFQF